MEKINPLLCSHSPRDITEVRYALFDCPYDIVYAKYMPIGQAYSVLRHYFLNHPEYTHYVACPDDLIITRGGLAKLLNTVEQFNYPVLSGVCNVDLDENANYLNFTKNLPHPTRTIPGRQVGWRYYVWYDRTEIEEDGILEVPYAGLACGIIERKVIEEIPFMDDQKFNKGEQAGYFGSVDVMFNNSLAARKIPMRVHTGVKFTHLRHSGPTDITIGEGYVEFVLKNTFNLREGKKVNGY